ncbi:hypothetical protein [Evansella clarkii]|uniref:hypothetical protein n=1 Tax=Evansella clarkii TaxID=79879 RepID=UPI000997E249|nr:hypothetical protein [Evansella clarkii]
MNEPGVFENPCSICGVKKATLLCDYVIKYSNGIIFARSWKQFQEANATGHNETCDLPICPDCSKNVGHHADMCPHHYKLHLQAKLPGDLEIKRLRQKAKIIEGGIHDARYLHR